MRKWNGLLREYLNEVLGPIDMDNLEISLGAASERKETGQPLDSFLDTF